MSELTINDLPDELLIKVFRYLDVVDWKSATVTCKLWKNLIESECRWAVTLKCRENGVCSNEYLLSGVRVEKDNFTLSTNRKFGTISVIWSYLAEDNAILKILQKHGHNVVKLNLRNCGIDNLGVLAVLLNFTPNLKHVDIRATNLIGVCNLSLDHALQPRLIKLKKMEISFGRDYGIIKCFQRAKLTTMKIWQNDGAQDYYGYHRLLVDFLSSQDMLTSLTSDTGYLSRSILYELATTPVPIPFRLTHLSIPNCLGMSSPQNNENLLRFVQSQAEQLTQLELGFGVPSFVYECVCASMTKLISLSVEVQDIPRDNERFEENCSVLTIKLLSKTFHRPIDDFEYLGNFLKKLPNVRHLKYVGCEKTNVLEMTQNLSKLESLFLDHIDERFTTSIGCVKFFQLKALHIGNLRCKIDWNEFTRTHSRLTELTICSMSNPFLFTSDDIYQIATNVDLQSLRLGVGFLADDRFFAIIRTKCTNLRVLHLNMFSVPYKLRHKLEVNILRTLTIAKCCSSEGCEDCVIRDPFYEFFNSLKNVDFPLHCYFE